MNKIKYRFILACILLLVMAHCRTDLSKSNCPNMFQLKKSNTTNLTKQQFKSKAQSFFSIYDNDYLKTSVQQIVINGNQAYLSTFISTRMTAYIIILVIFVICFVVFSICCVFSRSCPPDCLRRDLRKRPYTFCQFRTVAIMAVLASIGVVVPCFVAFSYIPQLKQNVQLSTCSLYIVLDSVLNGQKDTGWGGFTNLYSKISNVTKYLTESLPSMSLYLSGDQWLVQEMQAMKQMNLNIYNHNKQANYISPNPSKTKENLDNGLGYPMIESRFIARGLGPNGTANTMVTDLDKGLRTTQKLSTLAYTIELGAKRVIDSSGTLLTNTNSSLQTMDMYVKQLEKTKVGMDQMRVDLLDGLIHVFLDLIEGAFGVQILGGFSCLLGVVAAYRFQIFKCKSLVSLAWALFGIGFIGSLAVVFATLGLGSLGYGFCNYYDAMLYSPQEFNRLSASDSQNPFTKLDSCFFGDGNVLSKFSLGQEMGTVTRLFQLIKTYYDYQNQLSTNFIDTKISTAKLQSWMTTMEKYRDGIYVDYNETVTTDDNPNYAINKLNLYTKGGAGVPVCAKDRWVFDSTNCTNPNQTIYQAGTAENGVALETTNQSICISLNERFSDLMNNPWSPSDLTRRYTQTRGSCQFSYDKILQYGYTLIRFRDSRKNLFQGLYDELNQIYTKNILFNNNITGFRDRVTGFQASVSDLNNVVSNSIDGLMVSSNCKYIVDTLKFSYNMLCINTMHEVIRIGWCAVIVCGFCLVAMVFAYFFASWFEDVEKNSKWFEEEGYEGQPEEQEKDIESMGVFKLPESQTNDVGRDFEKLGQFHTYVGGKGKKQLEREKQLEKKQERVDSQDSSQEENPYALQEIQQK